MKKRIRLNALKLFFSYLPLVPIALVSSCSSNSYKDKDQIDLNKNFETWTNEQLISNKFSTINTNGKLDIVEKRGADDIYDADFDDGRANAKPLLGNIVNEQYKKLAQISYSVNFSYGNANYLGTAWLLDYQIPEGINPTNDGNSYNEENYPTKWYFATNTHVMDDLKTINSPYYETNTQRKPNSSTDTVILNRIKNPEIGTNNDLYKKSSFNNSSYEQFYFKMKDDQNNPLDNPPVRPIFLGFDYLKSSPDDFINNVPKPTQVPSDVTYTKTEEIADFSVFEIDFEKTIFSSSDFSSPNAYAMYVTSNYANWAYKDQFKPATKSLLETTKENPNKRFYSLGFPQEQVIGGDRTSRNVTLYINRPETLEETNYGDGAKLLNERHYNTFKNVPGIFDLMIGSPDFGYRFDAISNTVFSDGIIPYIYQGLAYVEQNGDMHVGSSGSIFVDEDNYIYGIHFASDFTAHVGINFALKSEGYDYKGSYGNYNLQSYDLINGGYDNQKSSYKDQLKKIYHGKNIRTNLFRDNFN